MTKGLLIALATVATAGFGLAACGSDDSSSPSTTAAAESTSTTSTEAGGGGSSGGSGGTVAIAADPSGALAFTKTNITAPAGSDTIDFENASSTGHNVEIEDSSGEDIAETDTISDGKTSTTADLQPGTYTFYCAVPGHREAGMEGTITVK
jgi:plastocyanin